MGNNIIQNKSESKEGVDSEFWDTFGAPNIQNKANKTEYDDIISDEGPKVKKQSDDVDLEAWLNDDDTVQHKNGDVNKDGWDDQWEEVGWDKQK